MSEGVTERRKISRVGAIAISRNAQRNHDICPECGGAFDDIDMSRGGALVFIHPDGGMCSLDTAVEVLRS